MLTFGVTGNRRQNGLSLSQAKALLKRFGGVFTGTLLGRKWAQNRFRFPYLREALWQAGYAVDTLETATDWSNVDGLLQKIEASLRDGLAAEGEKVHVFTHLSHVYGEGRASIPPTCSVRPRAMRRRWSVGSVSSMRPARRSSTIAAPSATSMASARTTHPTCPARRANWASPRCVPWPVTSTRPGGSTAAPCCRTERNDFSLERGGVAAACRRWRGRSGT